jgi:hypothetical protein
MTGCYNVACAFAMLHEVDRALDLLEVSLSKAPSYVAYAKDDRDLDSLRDHERFHSLIKTAESLVASQSPRLARASVHI